MPKGPKTYRLNNLSGGMNTVSEVDALASFDYQGSGVQAEASDIENFIPTNRGGQTKNGGFTLYKNTGSANAITGLYRFIKSDGTSLLLFSQTTKVYKLVSGTITDLGATISSGAYTHFETALDKCVICDGVSAPVFYDGSSITTISNGAPTGARQSLFYQNRLWLFGGTSNPSLLYFSKAGDLTQGYNGASAPDGGFVSCDVNDGQKITFIGKFFIPGSLEPVIIVGKERSIGIVTGTGSSADPYTFVKINQDTGIVGFRSGVQFGQDFAYLTPRGVSSYRTDSSIVNLIYAYLSEKIRPNFQALDSSNISKAIAFYDWKKTRISFAVPESGQTTPNVIYHYDTRLQCWYKERWNSGQDCTASFIDTDGTWYHGDTNGKIYSHDSNGTFDGGAINAYYKTGYMDFGDPSAYKHIRQARLMVRGNGNYGVGIASSLDYGIRNGTSSTLTLQTGSYTWNGGTWTSDPTVYQWGGAPIKFPKFFPGGDFQNIQLTISQAGAAQPVDIFELEFITEYTGLW